MCSLCTWCGVETAEEFCSEGCRQHFDTACRLWGAAEYEAERVSIFTLRDCLEQHRPERPTALDSPRPGKGHTARSHPPDGPTPPGTRMPSRGRPWRSDARRTADTELEYATADNSQEEIQKAFKAIRPSVIAAVSRLLPSLGSSEEAAPRHHAIPLRLRPTQSDQPQE